MPLRKFVFSIFAVVLCFSFSVSAADKKSKESKADDTKPSYEQPQPATENLDYTMYQRIRDEGLAHSHVMEYASGLMDGIGPRLTGSPNLKRANEWTRDQFTAMGCSNSHLEDWGEFGLGWRQLNAWVRMSAPDTAVFIAQALPWSPSSHGPVSGGAVWVNAKDEKDLENYKGKLAGKIVFFGEMREVKPVDKPLFERRDEADLKKTAEFPIHIGEKEDFFASFIKRLEFREKAGAFFAAEHAAGIVVPSRDGRNNGGSGGTIFDDGGSGMGWFTYKREHAEALPITVMAIENYGRVYRLLKANVPVTIEMDVESEFTGDHEHGFDTIAEIPGTDPRLKEEVVMVGGHLDSWHAGTGATDNGAGVAVAMEAVRILQALNLKPRRTIRVVLWSGEEEGILGSQAYVAQHFGKAEESQDSAFARMIDGGMAENVTRGSEYDKLSVYFNLDNGTGKIRGVYLQGNESVRSLFRQWLAPFRDMGAETLTISNTGATDHTSFDAIGLPAFQFIQDEIEYGTRTHHSNQDVFDRIQGDDLKQAATIMAAFLYNAAMKDEKLPRKPNRRP